MKSAKSCINSGYSGTQVSSRMSTNGSVPPGGNGAIRTRNKFLHCLPLVEDLNFELLQGNSCELLKKRAVIDIAAKLENF